MQLWLEYSQKIWKENIREAQRELKKENIQVTRRDVVRDNSVREEVDVFLESIEEDKVKEKEKFNFFRWLKELFQSKVRRIFMSEGIKRSC